jgi:hypothetical protein
MLVFCRRGGRIYTFYFILFFFFLVRLAFELRALDWQSWCSTAWATPLVHFALVILEMGSLQTSGPCWPQTSSLPIAASHGHELLVPSYFTHFKIQFLVRLHMNACSEWPFLKPCTVFIFSVYFKEAIRMVHFLCFLMFFWGVLVCVLLYCFSPKKSITRLINLRQA